MSGQCRSIQGPQHGADRDRAASTITFLRDGVEDFTGSRLDRTFPFLGNGRAPDWLIVSLDATPVLLFLNFSSLRVTVASASLTLILRVICIPKYASHDFMAVRVLLT